MAYFSQLHLQREPFSSSPDPEMFFQSIQHQGCLQKLELAIRLQRGLSVVIGDIGTGKSTLGRQLIQRLTRDEDRVTPHLILDPEFTSPLEFLTTITKTFGLLAPAAGGSEWQLKDTIKAYLFEQAVNRHKVPVLIIDEGQKLPGFCVEVLREFLNFETNQHKLLQIVIFAQEEFQAMLKAKANFADRITTYHRLKPLRLRETRAMIAFRIDRAHTAPGPPPRLFTPAAILAIHWLTSGYPRRIVMLCSKVMIAILVKELPTAGVLQVLQAARETAVNGHGRLQSISRLVTAGALVAIAIALIRPPWPATNPSLSVVRLATPPSPAVAAKEASPLPSPANAVDRMPPTLALPPNSTGGGDFSNAKGLKATALPSPPAPVKSAPIPEPPPAPVQAAPPDSPAVAADPSPAVLPPLPAALGTLQVEAGVSLSKMVARIYGRYSPKKLTQVLAANPQLVDPDHLTPGTPITFPTLTRSAAPPPQGALGVELARTPNLAAAYDLVKEYPESAPPLLLKPVLTAENGLAFRLVLEATFRSAESAQEAIRQLPNAWQAKAQVREAGDS